MTLALTLTAAACSGKDNKKTNNSNNVGDTTTVEDSVDKDSDKTVGGDSTDESQDNNSEAGSTTEEKDTEVEGSKTENKEVNSNEADEHGGQMINVGGKQFVLPFPTAELTAEGFAPRSEIELTARTYNPFSLFKNENTSENITVALINNTGDVKKAEDAWIYSLTFSDEGYFRDASLSNGVKFGMSKQEVLDIYGKEPDAVSDSSNGSKTSVTMFAQSDQKISVTYTFVDDVLKEMEVKSNKDLAPKE